MASRYEDENSLDLEVWLPDEVIKTINMSRQLNPETTDETLAEQYLIKAAPAAALAISHLSKFSSDPRLRLMASTYILDKVLGKSGTIGLLASSTSASGKSPVDDLLESVNKMAALSVEAESAQAPRAIES
jgi:hypothetical protein